MSESNEYAELVKDITPRKDSAAEPFSSYKDQLGFATGITSEDRTTRWTRSILEFAEVMGVDYKSTLKPALEAYSQKIKKDSVETLDELIVLQHQASELSADIEGKRSEITTLESRLNENVAGGILGLVIDMLVETLIFIIQASRYDLKSTESTFSTSRLKKDQ